MGGRLILSRSFAILLTDIPLDGRMGHFVVIAVVVSVVVVVVAPAWRNLNCCCSW